MPAAGVNVSPLTYQVSRDGSTSQHAPHLNYYHLITQTHTRPFFVVVAVVVASSYLPPFSVTRVNMQMRRPPAAVSFHHRQLFQLNYC